MPPVSLLVIADKKSAAMAPVSRVPEGVRTVVTDDPEELKAQAPLADAILFAHGNSELLKTLFSGNARAMDPFVMDGVEGILTQELREHRAPLTNGRGVFRWPLADWVAGVMLFFAFDLRRIVQQQNKAYGNLFLARCCKDKRWELSAMARSERGGGACAQLWDEDRRIAPARGTLWSEPEVDFNYGPAQLHELMASSDYVLAATPLTSETRGLIGAAELAAMKPGGILINVGRGPVVDEPALIRSLQSGAIRGAALDVFDVEPLPADHPFWKMSNVLLSPHTADRVEGFLVPRWIASGKSRTIPSDNASQHRGQEHGIL
jgi:phosphoglycerate dehydrogenase-like enzyme